MEICGKTLALGVIALSLPLFVGAQNTQNPQNSDNTQSAATNIPEQREAARMVPVNAVLSHTLDTRKDRPGSAVEAKLTQKARLSDGTELPSGSILMGQVVQGDMQPQGKSQLALRFDRARLKDGKVVPIRATIVGIAHPIENADATGYEEQNNWNDGMLQIDQLDVVPGVDLHSKIASQDSGVFVSTKKDDVKLTQGSEIQLAVAPGANAGV